MKAGSGKPHFAATMISRGELAENLGAFDFRLGFLMHNVFGVGMAGHDKFWG